MEIKTAKQQQVVIKHGGYRRFVETCLRLRWPRAQRIDWAHPRGTVQAQIIRSNWAAQCPHCAGQMFVQPGEPFFCPDCAMQGNDFKPMLVIFPKERQAIERLLGLRENPQNRNWLVGETINDLIRENAEHGIIGV